MFGNKIVKNASWIVGCKVAQSVLAFLVTMLTARFLGPSNYGVISYAASIVALVTPIAQLGLGNVLVQELINEKNDEGKIVGTTLLLNLIAAFFCIVGIISFTMIVDVSETETIIVCALYSTILFFHGAELIQYWFQSKYLSKYASIISLIAFAVVTVYKISLLILKVNVYWFAIANALDYLIIEIFLLIIYHRLGGNKLEFSSEIACRMLSKSKYYIISNIMVAVFSQTGSIVLKLVINESATGIYAATISCANLVNFVYLAIIDSFRPMIFENYKLSREKFENNIISLFSIIIYLSIAEATFITVMAKIIVNVIYGQAYVDAILPLRLVVWYLPFSFIGSIRNIWILAEGQQKWIWVINLFGAMVNIITNFFLVPRYGIVGASISNVITQLFTNVVISYFLKPIRPINRLVIKGLNPLELVKTMKKVRL